MQQTLHPARRPGETTRAVRVALALTSAPALPSGLRVAEHQSTHLGTPQHFFGELFAAKFRGLFL